MKILFCCPQWGYEHLDTEEFFIKVKEAGFDGVDTWLPENPVQRKRFVRLLQEYGLLMVAHQYQAKGNTITDFCRSLEYYLNICMESQPMLINSHSGHDHFTLAEQLSVVDTAAAFAESHGIRIAHETHRGRINFSPGNFRELAQLRPQMKITADLSHWVCVTESYLENFNSELVAAIKKTIHIHARVGFSQGPQIPDPRSVFWKKEVDFFLKLWVDIINFQHSIGATAFTITPEFGPPPYMWSNLIDQSPVADQWAINIFMKDLIKERFCINGQSDYPPLNRL